MHQHIFGLKMFLNPVERLINMFKDRTLHIVLQIYPLVVPQQVALLDLGIDFIVAVCPFVHYGQDGWDSVVFDHIFVKSLNSAQE